MAKVLIFGITGQDGSNMADYLLGLKHEVGGMIRRHSHVEGQQARIEHIKERIYTEYGDVTDYFSVSRIMRNFKPTHIINLAAMSHVRVSFDMPEYTQQVNYVGNMNILNAMRDNCPDAKFYFAGSSEIFGIAVDPDSYQRETTDKKPTSPYGISKLAGVKLTEHYRRAYGLHATVGILFNHSGLRRGTNFVEQKIAKGVADIKLGRETKLELGNLDTYRDFGASVDYVRAIWQIINHSIPDTFVVATGVATSVREICQMAFRHVGLNYEHYVTQNAKFMRDEELPYLRGDATKAKTVLGWKPDYTVQKMITEMVDFWLQK